MRSRLLLVSMLGLGLGLAGCDRRQRECDDLQRVMASASRAYDGDRAEEVAATAEQAAMEIDRLGPRTSIAPLAADYRASLVSIASEAREAHAVMAAVIDAGRPMREGPVDPADVAATLAVLERHATALAEPCIGAMFAGLANLFGPPDAGPPLDAERTKPDCEALDASLANALHPEPGASIATQARAIAAAFEEAKVTDPSLAEHARALAAAIRKLDPALSRIRVPAAELFALRDRFRRARTELARARAAAGERAAALQAACSARR
jgi:hypothetical protein